MNFSSILAKAELAGCLFNSFVVRNDVKFINFPTILLFISTNILKYLKLKLWQVSYARPYNYLCFLLSIQCCVRKFLFKYYMMFHLRIFLELQSKRKIPASNL